MTALCMLNCSCSCVYHFKYASISDKNRTQRQRVAQIERKNIMPWLASMCKQFDTFIQFSFVDFQPAQNCAAPHNDTKLYKVREYGWCNFPFSFSHRAQIAVSFWHSSVINWSCSVHMNWNVIERFIRMWCWLHPCNRNPCATIRYVWRGVWLLRNCDT